MKAVILQHTSAPVQFDPPPADPREQAVQPRYRPQTEDDWKRLEACEAVVRLADSLGSYSRLMSIVKTMAAIYGEKV